MSVLAAPDRAALLELRRYRLQPGRREELVRLFERELIEPQNAVGMQVLAQFRDADEPNHFVWLRGYPDADPDARAEKLGRFYGGPVWAAHRDAANATMVDSDDVLLLRPVGGEDWLDAVSGPPGGPSGVDRPPVIATTCLLDPAAGVPDGAVGALRGDGDRGIAVFVTADVPNRFPRLPVREDRALVWLDASGEGEAAARRRRERLARVVDRLGAALREPPHVATLVPTLRSLLPLDGRHLSSD
jgi:hypothetical protein